MKLRQTHHFCVIITFGSAKLYYLITLICLIILISHIAQLLLIRKFYCFCPGLHVSFKYVQPNHLRCPMMGEVFQFSLTYFSSPKRSLIKHTCSWHDKLIVLWTLHREAKIFIHKSYQYLSIGSKLVKILL